MRDAQNAKLKQELEATKGELGVLREKSTLSSNSVLQAEKRNQTFQTLLNDKNAEVRSSLRPHRVVGARAAEAGAGGGGGGGQGASSPRQHEGGEGAEGVFRVCC